MGDSLHLVGGGWGLAGTVLAIERVGWMELVGTGGVGGKAEKVRPRGPLRPAPLWDDQVKEELGSPDLLHRPDKGEPGRGQGSDTGRQGAKPSEVIVEGKGLEEGSVHASWVAGCFRSSLDSTPSTRSRGRVEIWKEGEEG